jgi:hypothetical protein
MAQNPGDNLVDTLKNTFVKPVQNVLDTVGKVVPSSLMPKSKPAPSDPQHDQDVINATHSFGVKAGAGDKQPPVKAQTMPSHKNGTDYVKKTGPAKLHKGEAVLKKTDADKLRAAKGKGMAKNSAMDAVAGELGGKKEATPKKEIDHIKTKKAKSGGYIHTHVHTHPETHPNEEHVSSNQDQMIQHMMQNMGTPNPGEAEADAGQSGVPGAAATPGASAGAPPAGPVAA